MNHKHDYLLDTSGLLCPMPLLKVQKTMKTLKPGDVLKVIATDPATQADFKAYTQATGNVLLHQEKEEETYCFWFEKR